MNDGGRATEDATPPVVSRRTPAGSKSAPDGELAHTLREGGVESSVSSTTVSLRRAEWIVDIEHDPTPDRSLS